MTERTRASLSAGMDRAGAAPPESLRTSLRQAHSLAETPGTGRRLFVVLPPSLPRESARAQVAQVIEDEPTLLSASPEDACVGYEIEGLNTELVQRRLLIRSPGCAELASRLHSRVDVVWK
jgi:hypothetical protein